MCLGSMPHAHWPVPKSMDTGGVGGALATKWTLMVCLPAPKDMVHQGIQWRKGTRWLQDWLH